MSAPRLLARRAAGPPVLTRSWSGPVMVRAAGEASERIIEGIAVPFGVVTTVRDDPVGPSYRETIERSAADGLDPTSVLVDYLTDPPTSYNTHQGSRLVGRGVSGSAQADGYHFAARVAQTAAGDELLELARSGVLTDMSVMFTPRGQYTRPDGVVARTAIDISRVTIVPRGAYPGATVTAVRAGHEEGNMFCPHCGARLQAGVAHICQGSRAAAEAANAAAAADDATEGAEDAEATPTGGSTSRPNRTRVTVDVERAVAEGIRTGLERAGVVTAEPSTRDRAAAERGAGAQVARGIGGAYASRPEFFYGPGSGRSFFGDAYKLSRGDATAEQRDHVERHFAMLEDIDRSMQRAYGFDGPSSLARAGDVLSSEIAGAYPNEYLPGLIVNRILKERPMGGFYQRFPLEDGRPRIYPVVTTSTSVAAQGAEGSNPAASDFATTGTTVTPVFYGGETKVSRQVLDGADPSTDVMLQTDLNEAYMQASEAIVRAAVEAGSTASGVTLTAATPNAGLIGLVVNHIGNVFMMPQRVFLPTTLTNSWLTQLDTTGRPLAPTINPFNASGAFDASAGIPLIGSVQGVPVAQSWSSTAGAGAGVGGVAVVGRASDFAIFESNLAQFQFNEGAEAPSAVRIGLWAYLVVGTRRGSRKATGA
jgi:HK97 family phage prohead protease